MPEDLITAVTELDQARYLTKIYAGGHLVYADEPEDKGGTNEAMPPGSLLLASLGSCTAITMRMYADRKEYPLTSIRIQLSISAEEKMDASTRIIRKIEMEGELTQEQRSRLMQIADKCPIHKILSNPITIESHELKV
ncbi:OsmC family protein [Pedobacter antarcticus]|uniref:OsmC family protein n=1 Tax=Pedobacter antarcticus TaxID=34086 RepID=UPI001C597222|nr:OsmC family protein [Pedobacter antarcticus]